MKRALTVFLAVAFTGCAGGGPAVSVPPGPLGGPIVTTAGGTVSVPATGGRVALPSLGNQTIDATFSQIGTATKIAVTSADGIDNYAIPDVNEWTACPFPLEEIEMQFPSALTLSRSPAFEITDPRVSGAQYFYIELYDEDASSVRVIAGAKVDVASSWPAETAIFPAMNASWNVVAGHHYVFEIVSSTSPVFSCGLVIN